jgi:hypothetical protein
MMELAIIGALIGIALGLRYKVLILAPAVTLAMIFALMVGVARADSFWSIVLTTAAVATALQFGYLAGIATIRCQASSAGSRSARKLAKYHGSANGLLAGRSGSVWINTSPIGSSGGGCSRPKRSASFSAPWKH